ncbi:leucine-rich repeat domain-containing protein [Aurantibacter sp.]|uniref:leucine-rich repeat domain-containing protein n=1 Tax=Aurantibacter sp. TaxID=2807103 RepID=UPI003267A13B
MKNKTKITILLLLMIAVGCSKKNDDAPIIESDAKELLTVSFNSQANPDVQGSVNGTVSQETKTAIVMVPIGTVLTSLTPTLTLSNKASYSPQGPQDFTNNVTYTITAENGSTATYVISVSEIQSSESQLLGFTLLKISNDINENLVGTVHDDTKSVRLITSAMTDVTLLSPTLEVSEGASYTPEGLQDFSEPVTYTVTAADGSTTEYMVNIRTERDLLIAISEANPQNTLEWNYNEQDIDDWNDVDLTEDGYVEYLHLDENLSIVPDEIGYFRKLKELDLDDNVNLTELPKTIGLLTNLKYMELDNNKLKELPQEFGQLTSLEDLDLNENLFTEFPEALIQLPNLIDLDISDNFLTKLPSEIKQMTALRELKLSNNKFEDFPDAVFQLENLEILDYEENQLKVLPQQIGALENLKILDLSDNLLTKLPAELQLLEGLQYLYLSRNDFEIIPEVVFSLSLLIKLTMNDNSISKISSDITSLIFLFELQMKNNLIKEIPGELDSMQNLLNLYITGNQIEKLPEELCPPTYITTLIKDDSTVCPN